MIVVSRRRHKRHKCAVGGKVRYRDAAEARRAMRKVQQRSTRALVPTRIYECPSCLGWHLTSQPLRGT